MSSLQKPYSQQVSSLADGEAHRILASERRMVLLEEIGRTGQVLTSEMSERLGVSRVTVRADLDDLARRGRVRRTHGGAIAADPDSWATPFDVRMALRRDEKRRIAMRASEYLASNETVIFDAGSTLHALAQQLPDVSNLRVYTPGLSIAQQLLGIDGVEAYLMGGRTDPFWGETTGSPREQGIKDLIAQKLFLGAMGVDDDLDIVDTSPDLAQNKLQFARRSRFIVLMIDSSKWGATGSRKVMPLDRVDVVITDRGVDASTLTRVGSLSPKVVLV